jgi:hypothetical protein
MTSVGLTGILLPAVRLYQLAQSPVLYSTSERDEDLEQLYKKGWLLFRNNYGWILLTLWDRCFWRGVFPTVTNDFTARLNDAGNGIYPQVRNHLRHQSSIYLLARSRTIEVREPSDQGVFAEDIGYLYPVACTQLGGLFRKQDRGIRG